MRDVVWVQRWVTASGQPNGISVHVEREDVDRFIERVQTRSNPAEERPEGAPAQVSVGSGGVERVRYLRSQGHPGIRISHLGEL